jgi:putative sigma-54 modulation protein
MRLQVKGKNVEVTPSMREYTERKLAKLAKQLAEQTQVEVELSEQRNPSIAASHVAEATIFTKGPTLRAREASPDMKASIDQLAEKLERQVKRYRDKRRRRDVALRGSAGALVPEPVPVEELERELRPDA